MTTEEEKELRRFETRTLVQMFRNSNAVMVQVVGPYVQGLPQVVTTSPPPIEPEQKPSQPFKLDDSDDDDISS